EIDQLDLRVGRKDGLLALQAVARADLDDRCPLRVHAAIIAGRPLPRRHANETAFAPFTISSTTTAAPTMLAPCAHFVSSIPRGFVHALQSHTCPPAPTNSSYRVFSGGSPVAATPSVPPGVPSHTASTVQTTT